MKHTHGAPHRLLPCLHGVNLRCIKFVRIASVSSTASAANNNNTQQPTPTADPSVTTSPSSSSSSSSVTTAARDGVGCATAAVDAQVPMTDRNPRTAAAPATTTSGGGAVSESWEVECPVCGSRFPVTNLAGMSEVENSSPEEAGLLPLGGGGDYHLVKVLESVLKIDPLAVSEKPATPVNCAKKGCTLLAVVFCPQCDKNLCKTCSDFLHEVFHDHVPAERSHELFPVKHAIQSARKELSELCTSLNLSKSRLDSAIVHLKSISDVSELHIKLISEQVEREFSSLRLSSQEREEDLKRKLREMNSPRVTEVGEQQTQLQGLVSSIDESVRYCEAILGELEADPMALLVKKQIKDHLTELSKMASQAPLEPVLPPSHTITFPKTILHPEQWGCSGTQGSFDFGLFSAINKHGFIQIAGDLSAMTVELSSPGTTTSSKTELNQIKFPLSNEIMTAKYTPQSVTNDKMHKALTPMECVVLPQPGSRFCEQHGFPLTILCWGPNPSTSKTMPPPLLSLSASLTPNNSISTPTQRGYPKIICTNCLFSGDHIGHTNHEHLPVAEKRLRASLKGTLGVGTHSLSNALRCSR
ncbi:hypothetical protein Pelo_17786 [Pelomyxa schiedti]|nr:hypothetical protein Pelo_17786 [Pelomyxa schiedti]